MKTLGMLGGMAWESTVVYYQAVNRRVREVVGAPHSMPCIIHSVDMARIVHFQENGEWEEAGKFLSDAAIGLKAAGAEGIILCCNTMHTCAPEIEAATQLPLLHIVDVTAQAILKDGFSKVALLGTKYTMELKFFREKLEKDHGMEVFIPDESGRDGTQRVIYGELHNGIVKPESRAYLLEIIGELINQGAQCLILGCTELIMLLSQKDIPVPIYDTLAIHAQASADWAIGSDKLAKEPNGNALLE